MVLFLFIYLLGFFPGNSFAMEEVKPSPSPSGLSSIETYNKSASTQKTYKVSNDGRSKDSKVTSYNNASVAAFNVYEDKDLDGRFGEREAKNVDTDKDTRKGENEAQLGTEYVTQNQKITTLNNMGFGSSLSEFKAAGQTQRSSIFVEKEKEASSEAPPSPSPSPSDSKGKKRVLIA